MGGMRKAQGEESTDTHRLYNGERGAWRGEERWSMIAAQEIASV